jgi:orotidine-5'-phosphate decarboxylase
VLARTFVWPKVAVDKVIRIAYQAALPAHAIEKVSRYLKPLTATGRAMTLGMTYAGRHESETVRLKSPKNVDLVNARKKLVVALDKPTPTEARALVNRIGEHAEVYKIGLELVLNGGVELARELKELGKSIFLDMKLLDIPNTVEHAVANAVRHNIDFLTVHGVDDPTLNAAVNGRERTERRPKQERLKLLSVTVLTSSTQESLSQQGIGAESALQLSVRRAVMAQRAGFDGVIASGHEAAAIRRATNPDFIIKVPGIRPTGSATADQKRVMTPSEAIRAGASYLVVGRPILHAERPEVVTEEIVKEIAAALR